MQAIVAAMGALLAKFLGASTLKFLAMKALAITITTLVLPVVLFNVFVKIQETIMNYAVNHVSSSGVGAVTIELSGMGAWLGEQLQVSLCLSIIMSAVATRFVLNMIGK